MAYHKWWEVGKGGSIMGKAGLAEKQQVRSLVQAGLKANAILAQGVPVSRATVTRIIRSEQRVDPKRSIKVPVEVKQQIYEYVQGEGKNETVRAVALKFRVGDGTVIRCKSGVYLRTPDLSQKRVSIETGRRAKISVCYARVRQHRYFKLCELRATLESENSNILPRTCQACGERWYADNRFFNFVGKPKQDGSRYFATYCTVCLGEIAFLVRTLKKSYEEAVRMIKENKSIPPVETQTRLDSRYSVDVSQGCKDEVVNCSVCKKPRFHDPTFFRTLDGQVSDVCLACPGRRFFHK